MLRYKINDLRGYNFKEYLVMSLLKSFSKYLRQKRRLKFGKFTSRYFYCFVVSTIFMIVYCHFVLYTSSDKLLLFGGPKT